MQHTIKKDAHKDLPEMMDLYRELLEDNRPVLLAGGAPRDLLLEKPIKDFDFFVAVDQSVTAFAEALTDITVKLFMNYGKPEIKGGYGYAGMTGAMVTISVKNVDVVLINPNGLKTHQDLVERFDSPLCQTWIDEPTKENEVVIQTTQAFDDAVDHKVFGVYGGVHTDRAARLHNDKFSDYLLLPLERSQMAPARDLSESPFDDDMSF